MHVFCLLIYFYSFPSEKFRFSKEFIELRRQALDLFVNRIASHPELKQSDVLRTFLQADEEVNHSMHSSSLPRLFLLCVDLGSY